MKKLLLFLSLAPMLIGCTIDNHSSYIYPPCSTYWQPNNVNPNGQYAIGGYTNGQSAFLTRAAIPGGLYTNFGLYAWTEDSVVMNNYNGVFTGNTWGYSEDVKYFNNYEDEYNFIGVIPKESVTNFNNKQVTVLATSFTTDDEGAQNTTQNGLYAEDRELLYASASVLKVNYGEGATLNFKHANTKVYLKFTSNDDNTLIIDYYPSTSGYNVYTMSATTVPAQGPTISSINISDEDIDYINSHFTASKGFTSYQTNNTIEGDLSTNMYQYLLNKYPSLNTITLNNWTNYVSNSNMRLIHINKAGVNDSYNGVWVNILSVNWNSYTVSGSSGVNDIIVLPATSVIGDGSDAILASYPDNVSAVIDLTGISISELSNTNTLTFSKPISNITSIPVLSPTTWYTFPASVNSVNNCGYTIKISYIYKGQNVYDARVYIPASECQWEEGKYYTYIIAINGTGNGNATPTNKDANDPKVISNSLIGLSVNIVDYESGEVYTHTIQ